LAPVLSGPQRCAAARGLSGAEPFPYRKADKGQRESSADPAPATARSYRCGAVIPLQMRCSFSSCRIFFLHARSLFAVWSREPAWAA